MAISFKVGLYCDVQIFGLISMFNLVSMQSVYILYGILFRVMDSALHLSGWKAIFHFCSQFGIFYVLTLVVFHPVPALRGAGSIDVLYKTCSVLCCVLEQARVDNSSAGTL